MQITNIIHNIAASLNAKLMNIENFKTPHLNCLHPVKINNNGSVMLVPCGQCAACRISRSNTLVQMCNLESIAHKYMYFVTLTYSDEYVPLFEVSRDISEEAYGRGFNAVFRLSRLHPLDTDVSDDAEIFASTNDAELATILQKQNRFDDRIAVLYRPDTQRFIKRLNGRLKRVFKKIYSDETFKMRYFLCGEYGPLHLRPHYHIIFWFDTQLDCSELAKNIRACWPFGRIDCQIALGGCGCYVSGYLNSYSCVPKLFTKCRPFRGFASRSNRLGFDFLMSEKDKFYGCEKQSISEVDSSLLRFWTKIKEHSPFVYTSKFDSPTIPIDGDYVPVFFYRYVKAWYFPTTVRYNLSDRGIVKEDFMLYEYATRYYTGVDSVSDLVRKIITDLINNFLAIHKLRANEIRNTYYDNSNLIGFLANMSTYLEDARYFVRWSNPNALEDYLAKTHFCDSSCRMVTNLRTEYDRLFSRLYIVFRISKHFIEDILEGCLSEADYYLDIITSYHAQNEQMYWDSCVQLAEMQNDLAFMDDEFAKHCFPDSFDALEFEKTRGYKYYSEHIEQRASNRIKHKVMNDANKVLFN